jgi:hypothetical protein
MAHVLEALRPAARRVRAIGGRARELRELGEDLRARTVSGCL